MNVTIPIYVEESRTDQFSVQPLFFANPPARNEVLSRAMAQFVRELRKYLEAVGRTNHGELARLLFCPDITDSTHKLTLELRRRHVKAKFLFVMFETMGRRVAFTPSVPQLWFDVPRGTTLEARATAALTQHFRDLERDEEAVDPADLALSGRAWTSTAEFELSLKYKWEKPATTCFAVLNEFAIRDGAAELDAVGRCLNWQYPDGLERLIRRDPDVAELTRLLTAPDRRPVLIVGPRMVGKTALVHEFAYRQTDARRSAFSSRNNVWLLSPQRLISGMMYVGQWENRLHAILTEAAAKNHVLYFDDLIGLFSAGKTNRSSLSAAQVLKPHFEQRDVRFLAEITPEGLRVLQEKDRALADMFHLLRIDEPTEAETRRILIHTVRQLEDRFRMTFATGAIPAVMDVQRSFVRELAFPGKAVQFLRRLAVKNRRDYVSQIKVLSEFRAISGLNLAMLDPNDKLRRDDIEAGLKQRMIGQQAAISAAADAIVLAKARLNDTGRPLGSFLFLGPTGVGKTECAKSIAAYLFGSPERIVRFDMNEFISPMAAMRLVGSFSEPDGLLTSAVRRQPFCVVLLDEIEKAHPDVFDVLLQVLGEGRLTDALGRTVSFANAIVILTSNLGVKEAEARMTFSEPTAARDAIFVRAAERFFRPEFFNRLDRVIPFSRLTREEIARIAEILIRDVFGRDGLVRRRCMLRIEPAAMDAIVDAGYHPTLGARALKRAIEQRLTRPVAAQLATISPDLPMIVRLFSAPEAPGELSVETQPLAQIEPLPAPVFAVDPTGDPLAAIDRVRAAVDEICANAEALRPSGTISADTISSAHDHYFAVRELAEQIRATADELEEHATPGRGVAVGRPLYSQGARRNRERLRSLGRMGTMLRELAMARDIDHFVTELLANAGAVDDSVGAQLGILMRETALVQTVAEAHAAGHPTVVNLAMRTIDHNDRGKKDEELAGHLVQAFNANLGLEATFEKFPDPDGEGEFFYTVMLRGPHAWPMAQLEAGTHLFVDSGGRIVPIHAVAVPIADESRWQELVVRAMASAAEFPSVIRIYEPRVTIDLRTGSLCAEIGPEPWREWLLAALPIPRELIGGETE